MIRLVHSASRAKTLTLDDEAMAWVVRLTAGTPSAEDVDEFREWRDRDADHLAALERAQKLWRQLGSVLPEIERRRHRRVLRSRSIRWLAPIAATFLFGAHLGHQYWTEDRFDHVTAVGERRTLLMGDGSRIAMSGDTALDVTMEHGIRRVDLARGEIAVQVRHDAARPFVVHAGNAHFRDVGTVFDVARAGDGANLVVAEGLVEASYGDRRQIVTGGKSVSVVGGLSTVRSTDPHLDLAWVSGRLILKNKTLPQILAAVAPHHRGRIVLLRSGDEPLLSATIDLDHVDQWLVALEQLRGLRATQIAGYTFLM